MREYVVGYTDDLDPTHVRERVVRCRDCAMYDEDDGTCYRDPNHAGRWCPVGPDGFCAWGTPKEDE